MNHKRLILRSFWFGLILIIVAVVMSAHSPYITGAPASAAAQPATPHAGITSPDAVTALPREETLYFNGIQWGSVMGWNPYSSSTNNAMAITPDANARVIVFETPYIFNMITGEQFPLLADGPYTWNAAMTEITFDLKTAAHWRDGTPVTAADVAYTWATHLKYETGVGVSYRDFIDTIEALDAQTVVVKAKLDLHGDAVNPLQVIGYLSSNYVIQKAWTQTLEARTGGDAGAFIADLGLDVIASGPYYNYFTNDQMVALVRDDNYWGKSASMWGKLPAPKYLAHVIYANNDAGLAAFLAGQVDISQQYIANVQDLWLVDDLPVSTYMDEAPYSIGASLPTAYFNLKSLGLDNVAVRKAIAIAVDYDAIVASAMTNQSATFTQVPRSVMNPSDVEQALYDHEAVADLQWVGSDIAGANALLDSAGIIDTDGDGWRDIGGQKLSYNAVCPNGWLDWQAAIEILASVGEKIGIEIVTLFPEWSVYQTVFTDGNQTEYDIFMVWTTGSGPTNPWARVRGLMSSEFAGTVNNWNGNFGGYINPAVDAIITAIPAETDHDTLVDLYTAATEIYLTDVPSFTLMYRPDLFHTVNETIWTNFPNEDDGLNIPPMNLISGYSIAGLYNLTVARPNHIFLPTLYR
jgi:peptide/nickel transport system substrate-binding protein